ncbi:MAG: SDR family oxidoreductase [Acidimicrobiales bacterium]|jgi:NAD(P)-dependent dehydrogenase (short-subunit alcohol dehydrogenase family)
MTGRLQGRAAVITGAGDGIGEGIARRFAAEGAQVMVTDINGEAAERVAHSLREEFAAVAHHLTTDVREKNQVIAMIDATVDRFGAVDVLVNNAWGGGQLSRLENKTDEQLAHGMSVAYFGPFWAMQAAFPHMRSHGRGNIISLCSLNGVNAHIGTTEYNCAKEALRALTRTAAREWAQYGIVANIICPGAKSAAFRSLAEAHPEIARLADETNPMGRLGDPEMDIAPVAVFLASDDARYLTGNTLFVDGGSHINGVAWAPELPE